MADEVSFCRGQRQQAAESGQTAGHRATILRVAEPVGISTVGRWAEQGSVKVDKAGASPSQICRRVSNPCHAWSRGTLSLHYTLIGHGVVGASEDNKTTNLRIVASNTRWIVRFLLGCFPTSLIPLRARAPRLGILQQSSSVQNRRIFGNSHPDHVAKTRN